MTDSPSSLAPRLSMEALLAEYDAVSALGGDDGAYELAPRLAKALRSALSSLASARSAAFAEAAKECREVARKFDEACAKHGDPVLTGEPRSEALRHMATRLDALAAAPAEAPEQEPRVGDEYEVTYPFECAPEAATIVQLRPRTPCVRVRWKSTGGEQEIGTLPLPPGWRLVRRGEPKR